MLIDLSLSGLTWIRCGSLNLSLRLDLRIFAFISNWITRSAEEPPWLLPAETRTYKLLRLLCAVLLLDLDPSLVVGVTHSSPFVTTELSGMLVLFGTYR